MSLERGEVGDYIFFFNEPATPEIYTLSLHDPLPISRARRAPPGAAPGGRPRSGWRSRSRGRRRRSRPRAPRCRDRKSTRLNSSHANISYAVFCLKKNNIIELYYNSQFFPDIISINKI